MDRTRGRPAVRSNWPLALGAALLIGVLAAVSLTWLVAGVGMLVATLILSRHALIRSIAVIGGGLLILQLSSEVTVEKGAYLGIVVIASLFGLANVLRHSAYVREIGAAPLLIATTAVLLLVAVSGVVALLAGTTVAAWARDTPAYWLLVAGIVLGLDLGVSQVNPRQISLLLLVAGLASAVGFTATWWGRRHLVEVPVGHLFFPSMFLPGAALSLAVARVFARQRPLLMALIATLLIAALLVTGTRSGFVFAVPVVIALIAAKGVNRVRLVPAIAVGLLTLAALTAGLGIFADRGELDLQMVQQRLASTLPVLLGGNVTADPSLLYRSLQTTYLYDQWTRDIWFGLGPGQTYTGVSPGSATSSTIISVDSPMAAFVRFGLFGVAALLALFVTLVFGRLRRHGAWVPATALLGFAIMVLVWGTVSSPLDDKGVALGLIPLIALAARERLVAVPQALANHVGRQAPQVQRAGALSWDGGS